MSKTTIQLDETTKEQLDKRKLDGESYDAALSRLLNDDNKLLWDEQEIRNLARLEAESAIEDMAHNRP